MKYKKLYLEILELDTTYILVGYWIDIYGYYVKYDDPDKYIYAIKTQVNVKVNTEVKFNQDTITNFSNKLRGKLI